jgi:phytoene dehydrogenase-like protein
MGADPAANHAAIARFSRRDADRHVEYEAFLDGIARALEPALDAPPPRLPRPRWRDLGTLARVARGMLALGSRLPDALGLLLGPARPVLEQWFESEPLRSTLATDAVIGAWASPSTAGTGYVLFHHVMGETGGARGVWAYVEGGMGRLSEALASAVRDAGGEIATDVAVSRVLVENGRACGVETADGAVVEAPLVLSNADPIHTFLGLVGRDRLPEPFARGIEALDMRSPSLKINLVLDRLPRFRHAGATQNGVGPEHRGTIHLGCLDLDDIERAFAAACAGRLPDRPLIELTIPSAVDPTLAPAGRFVASMFVQYAPWAVDGTSWDIARDRFADRVFALVDEVAPGFSSSVVHREVLAPPDLERVFGLTGGNIFHGAMTLDRLMSLRPLPGSDGYRTPVENLWLCGAAAHPGGGVMGACGRNAAREVLRTWSPGAR